MDDFNPIPLLIILFLGFIGFVIYFSCQDEEAFEHYKMTHHCRIVGEKAASTGIGVSSSGKMVTTFIPPQTIYRCDGGEIIIR